MATKVMVVTHGTLAYALRDTMEMFFGESAQEIATFGLRPDDSPADLRAAVHDALEINYSDDGVLVFVDMISGTPFNTVAMTLEDFVVDHPHVECVAGVNLPILIETFGDCTEKNALELKKQATKLFPQTFVDLRKMLEF